MNISCYFPGHPNSITKKLTDHEYSRREIALTCLVTGLLSATIGYTQKNAFLLTGTGVFVTNQILYSDTQDEVKTPMRILSFVSFCSFLGLSLKHSWVKPSNVAPSTWTRFIIKTTSTLLALSTLSLTAFKGGDIFAKHTIKILDEKSSIRLLVIGTLTASAASTFLIPRLGYLIPHVLGSSLFFNLVHTLQTKESLNDALALFQKSSHYPLLLLLGSSIGLLSRSLLGPKNYTPSLPLLAKVLLPSLTTASSLWFITACAFLSSEGLKIMTDTDLFAKQSLKDTLLDGIKFAENSDFNSFKELDSSLAQKFPTTSDSVGILDSGRNGAYNILFKVFISERLTPNRQLPEALRELKEFLNRLT